MSELKKPTIIFWFVAVLALLWNLSGLASFIADLMRTPEDIAKLPEARRVLYEHFPSWTKIFYGMATIGGVLGSIGLLLRKGWSIPLFLASLVGVVIQQGYTLFATDAVSVMGNFIAGFALMLFLISLFLWWWAKKCQATNLIS